MGVADSYDAVAADYAAQFDDELARKPFDASLLASLRARWAGGAVVDLGCGPGHIGRACGATVGLDLSHAMLQLAPFPLRVRGDLEALPFRTGSLVGAVAFYCLIHVASLDASAREMRRALVRGGVAVIAVHEGVGTVHRDEWYGKAVDVSARFWTRDEMVRSLEHAGFTVESAVVREPYEGEVTRRLYVTASA